MIPQVLVASNPLGRRLYFNNALVESLVARYHFTGCTDVKLRDEIMSHATELIRQIILVHKLNRIAHTRDNTNDDQIMTAWMQIESCLYKARLRAHCAGCYDPAWPNRSRLPQGEQRETLRPGQIAAEQLHCPTCQKQPEAVVYRGETKLFNFWSGVTLSVTLASIKKEGRDASHAEKVGHYFDRRHAVKGEAGQFDRFITDIEQAFCHDENAMRIIAALKRLAASDDFVWTRLVPRLMREAGCSRAAVVKFLKLLRLRRDEFPIGI